MKTLVYFASGPNRKEYQNLNFDKIYLVDDCFKIRNRNNVFSRGKIECIGMDCLESIEFLRKKEVQIDFFVSLNEGIYEGGARYAINSDMFLGYAMPLFKNEYIHIMDKNFYHNIYPVSMDLPYSSLEIKEDDTRYLNPFIFSKEDYHVGHAKVFQMTKIYNKQTLEVGSSIKLSIIHDSIWNFYEELDCIAISFKPQNQNDFFDKISKVVNLDNKSLDEILADCAQNKFKSLGFTPLANNNYDELIRKIEAYKDDFPMEVKLFHLNKNSYNNLKEYFGNKG